MSEKLKIKDLVTIGIFFVIYYILYFAVGIVTVVPILFLCWPAIIGIAAGIPVMLFMAKTPKPFAFFIFGMLPSIFNVVTGWHFMVLIVAFIIMLIAQLVVKAGGYKSFKHNAVAYGLFSVCASAGIMQILVVHDRYMEIVNRANMSPEFIEAMERLVSWPSLALVTLGAFLGGIIGALIGKAMLKKHFEKAGIV